MSVEVGGSLSGDLIWRGQGGLWPAGSVRGSLSLGVYGEIEFLKGMATGSASGTGNVEVTLDKEGFRVSDAYFRIAAEAAFGPFHWDGEWRYPPSSLLAGQSFASFDSALYAALNQGVAMTTTVSLQDHAGTGNVYSGTAVLTDIGSDLVDDGVPALALASDALVYAFWARESADTSVTLGNTIVYASFDGVAWSAPQMVTDTLGFNRDLALATDGDGDLVLVWAHADSAGFTIHSDPDTVLAAYEAADVWYVACQPGGSCSTPTPLTALSGQDT